ncbi:MAG: hypothetical protein Kow00121_22450 [Elainellaceae cyanobacterium]
MTLVNAKNLTLEEVHRLFQLERHYSGSFAELLTLEPLSDREQQEIHQTRAEFDHHLTSGEPSEGQVKLIAVSPLLRLAGFYRYPFQVAVEEGIARIEVTDEDTVITGRFNILAINRAILRSVNTPFWVLVIESKGGAISPSMGLPQLLTYAYRSLQQQPSIWGLVTNGEFYRFVYMQGGDPPRYYLLPSLNLLDVDSAHQLLQVLKAIRQQSATLPNSAVA